jgi:hypothetical protein
MANRDGFEPIGKYCRKSEVCGAPGRKVEILDRIHLPQEVRGHTIAEPQDYFCHTLVEYS